MRLIESQFDQENKVIPVYYTELKNTYTIMNSGSSAIKKIYK